jgi:hypothetical protein
MGVKIEALTVVVDEIPRRRCLTLPARGLTRRLDEESAVRVIIETSEHAFDECGSSSLIL